MQTKTPEHDLYNRVHKRQEQLSAQKIILMQEIAKIDNLKTILDNSYQLKDTGITELALLRCVPYSEISFNAPDYDTMVEYDWHRRKYNY